MQETIVGDIEDEHDEGELVEERISDNEFVLSARLDVDYLAEQFGLNFPQSEDYDTLAGWILHHTGVVPEQGTVIDGSVAIGENCIIGPFVHLKGSQSIPNGSVVHASRTGGTPPEVSTRDV